MRRSAWGFFALLAAAVFVPLSATGSRVVMPPESLTRLITRLDETKSPQLVALVRVVSVDSVALDNAYYVDPPKDSGAVLLPARRRLSRLEVLEWLRGGLDGEEIEVGMVEGGFLDQDGAPPSLFPLAGVDTMGAIVFLRKQGHGWVYDRGISGSFADGFRPVPQRAFKAYRDSVVRGRKKTP